MYMVGVVTGGSVYVQYGLETGNFADAANAIVDRSFGAKTSISSFTLTNNRIDLNKLGQLEVNDYAYGTQSGTIGVNFVLADSITSTGTESSGHVFRFIYGAPSAGGVYPSAGIGVGKTPLTSSRAVFNVGINTNEWGITGTSYKVRTLRGCVLNNLSLSTSIGETVNCSADFSFGVEDKPSNTYSAPTITHGTPYTFAHAVLRTKLKDGSITALQLVQDVEISYALNNELLYSLGSHQAVDSFRKVLDITGRCKLAFSDWKIFERVLAQIGKGDNSAKEPNISTGAEDTVELDLTFTNGNKSIKIELAGVSITDIGVTGLEPVEPVYQEITFKAKSSQVSVDTTA